MTDEDYKKEIGRRIRECRTALGWSLGTLAAKSKLKRARLGHYESGTRMPGPAEINILAMTMGASGPYLMCLADEPAQRSEIEDLPPVFQDAVRLHIERYREVAAKLPVSVLHFFQKPTSENYEEWERAIEQSYRTFASSAIQSDVQALKEHKERAERVLASNRQLQKKSTGKK